ncbi:uncharacterized protein BYT42DRAFT_492348 [Radiomyces spectabilis]|uniref:uncharacterized protein n=1 Tax=Radiomyces spectabilis TaxID=64574 RepID=UPI0022204C87|nr:uncharacterized protein BYT42DRAFT_492348 [Radiomyces spectabilis]KAI8388449.1 hypothetical protein BYT42DRAFT_492348 [Radiomyces spectabilis]
MPINAITGLLSIVDDLLADKINRKVAYSKIISMTLEKHLEKFAMALGQLVRRLPSEPIREDFGEAELCSRFVDPFLSGLFDNPDDDVYLRWTNVFNGKTNEQPAICITRFCGANWEMNVGYGEVQCAARDKDDHVICRDLLKLTVSCKEALDEQLMEGMLAIQVLGRTIKFYLLVLPATGLYALIDLAVIEVPDSLKSLPSLVTEAANIIKVLDIFERLCVPASDVATTMSRRTPTLSLSQLGQLFAISEHRKRPRHLRPQSN